MTSIDPGAVQPRDMDETALANSIGSILSTLLGSGSTVNTGAGFNPTAVGPLTSTDNLTNISSGKTQPNQYGIGNPDPKETPFQPLTGTSVNSGGLNADEANPVPNGPETISQPFGNGHPGIDIGVPVGTTLVAAINGTITNASNTDPNGYGNMVEITGANGIVVRYGHMSYIGAKVGEQVKAGQPIGKSGGDPSDPNHGNSTGPHLHFEVDQDGKPIDPSHFLAVKGNGVVAGIAGDAAPVDAAPGRTINPQDAVDTAMSRLTGVLSGKGDPGSENTIVPTATTTTGANGQSVDTSKMQGMDAYFAQVLTGIGAPVTDANMQFLRAWMRAEGGSNDNPFNTTQGEPGDTTINGDGVRRYPDQATGLRATISTLMQGNMAQIRQALLNGTNAMSAAQALAASPWGTGGLVAQILGG